MCVVNSRRARRISLFCSVLLGAGVLTAAGQEEPATEVLLYPPAGIARGGYSGLFTVPSPSLLSPGTVAAGLSYEATFRAGDARTAFPAGFSFGFAKRMEAFASFGRYVTPRAPVESQSTFGLKANVLYLEDGARVVSLMGRVHAVTLNANDVAQTDATGYSAAVLLGTHLFGESTGYLEGGYAWTSSGLPDSPGRFLGGVGVTYPLVVNALLAAEVSSSSRLSQPARFGARVGGKIVFLDHLQMALGVEAADAGGAVCLGGFLGFSFSSDRLGLGTGSRSLPPELLPEPPPLEDLAPRDSSVAPDSSRHFRPRVSWLLRPPVPAGGSGHPAFCDPPAGSHARNGPEAAVLSSPAVHPAKPLQGSSAPQFTRPTI
jgi:hypothetical protein